MINYYVRIKITEYVKLQDYYVYRDKYFVYSVENEISCDGDVEILKLYALNKFQHKGPNYGATINIDDIQVESIQRL